MLRAAPKTKPAPNRATRRAINKQINAAICQLQLADEAVDDQEAARARGHFKAAKEAIEEGTRALKLL